MICCPVLSCLYNEDRIQTFLKSLRQRLCILEYLLCMIWWNEVLGRSDRHRVWSTNLAWGPPQRDPLLDSGSKSLYPLWYEVNVIVNQAA